MDSGGLGWEVVVGGEVSVVDSDGLGWEVVVGGEVKVVDSGVLGWEVVVGGAKSAVASEPVVESWVVPACLRLCLWVYFSTFLNVKEGYQAITLESFNYNQIYH